MRRFEVMLAAFVIVLLLRAVFDAGWHAAPAPVQDRPAPVQDLIGSKIIDLQAQTIESQKYVIRHLAVMAAFPGCEHRKDYCRVDGNSGGSLVAFREAGNAFRRGEAPMLVVDGPCYSGCALAADVGRPNVCVTKSARLFFHASSDPGMVSAISDDVIGWVSQHGGFPAYETQRFTEMDSATAAGFFAKCSPDIFAGNR